MTFYFPSIANIDELLKRINSQERELLKRLADLENLMRSFKDFERPAYQEWLQLELGPQMVEVQENLEKIYERRLLVQRVEALLERYRLTPREALYVALGKYEPGEEGQGKGPGQKPKESKKTSAWDQDEVEARRQAKRDAKRAARRMEKKQKISGNSPNGTSFESRSKSAQDASKATRGTSRLVSLYRELARKLHPDSPVSIKNLPASRVLSLWMEVQTAYSTSNVERLLAIAAWIGARTLDDAGKGPSTILTLSERLDHLKVLTKSCSRLEAKLSQLLTHPAWNFRNVRGNARRKLRQKAARELEEEIARTQEALDALDDFIESIGSPRPPKKFAI